MELRTRRTTGRARAKTSVKAGRAAKKSAADPEAAMMAAWQKSMTPGAGHKRLEPLVGTFEVKSRIWMAPGAPSSDGTGTSKHRWVLGGRYLEQVYRGKTMGMPFRGIGYTGFDNVQKKYVGTWMDSMGTGIMTSVGEGKPTSKKIEFLSTLADPFSGQTITQRSIIRVKDRDRHTFEMWARDPSGKEFRSMLIEYTRK